MHKRFAAALLALVAVGALPRPAHAWMKEGVAAGVVITTGEDRVVVAVQEGGQITFEAANIKQGDQWVKDEHQLAFIKTLKQNDRVRIGWGTDHTGHYYIREIVKDAGDAPAERKGKVVGTVITTGPKRVVIQKAEGGQMTLEPGWVNTGGGWHQDEKQIAFFATLKQGDQVEANWVLDGTHYQVESIKRTGEASDVGAPAAGPGQPAMAAEIRALRSEIGGLRQEIANLKALIDKLAEQKK